MSTLDRLLASLPQAGRVEWLGVRPARRQPLTEVDVVEARVAAGLTGDRCKGGGREVTLIQAEHLAAVASMLGLPAVDAGLVRRNVVVRGINLLALVGGRFRIGEALLEGTGRCHP